MIRPTPAQWRREAGLLALTLIVAFATPPFFDLPPLNHPERALGGAPPRDPGVAVPRSRAARATSQLTWQRQSPSPQRR